MVEVDKIIDKKRNNNNLTVTAFKVRGYPSSERNPQHNIKLVAVNSYPKNSSRLKKVFDVAVRQYSKDNVVPLNKFVFEVEAGDSDPATVYLKKTMIITKPKKILKKRQTQVYRRCAGMQNNYRYG